MGVSKSTFGRRSERIIHSSKLPDLLNRQQQPKLSTDARECQNLYRGFKPPPASIDTDDVNYLTQKGVFSLPSKGFREQLLQSYIDFAHPLRPVLDIEDLLAMENCQDNRQISYLLIHAVMLGGSLFVGQEHLIAAGYPTRRAIRQAFYEKCRVRRKGPLQVLGNTGKEKLTRRQLLYEHDYEQDELVIAQALMLMSLWYAVSNGNHEDCWYWTSIAIGLIKRIDTSMFQSKTNLDQVTLGKWRRLWWTAFIMDRFIAMGMNLPTRILRADYTVPMLEFDDFNLDQGYSEANADLDISSLYWDKGRIYQLAKTFISKVKLSICIDNFLGILRSDNKDPETQAYGLQCTIEELQSWISYLPKEAALDLKPRATVDTILTVHQAGLYMTYLCTVAFVHKARTTIVSLLSHPYNLHSEGIWSMAQGSIQSIASNTATIVQYLKDLDLVRYLPQSVVMSFLHVNVIHLMYLTAVNNISGIFQSMHVVDVMKDCYFDINYGVRLVNAVFKRDALRTPPLCLALETDFSTSTMSSAEIPLLNNTILDSTPNEMTLQESHQDILQPQMIGSELRPENDAYQPNFFPQMSGDIFTQLLDGI
ncbi:fungal-specific transcription factor domain-containing protein [Xylogone sp. PMI_703]|nr:fungal-specific transcription factor domain-containing protein [Xylogone sp. PMI_703]